MQVESSESPDTDLTGKGQVRRCCQSLFLKADLISRHKASDLKRSFNSPIEHLILKLFYLLVYCLSLHPPLER